MVEPLTPEQIAFAQRMVTEWLRACEDNGKGAQGSPDASHSNLLPRLLSGKPLLPKPPPLRMSYPSWDLLEKEEVEIWDLFELNYYCIRDHNNAKIHEGPVVVIDQDPDYVWVDKEQGLLCYLKHNYLFRYFERDVIRQLVNPPTTRIDKGKFLKYLPQGETTNGNV